MSKKSALARKRAEQEAKQRRKRRLIAIGIGAAAVVIVAAIAAIVYFSVQKEPYPAGLEVEDLVKGTGEKARDGDFVSVHYTGWLVDGTAFDSSLGGDPLEFTLGAGEVIKGWDAGVKGMRVGGIRQLTIAPELAYGAAGSPPLIPANATLIFEVELMAVE